MAAGQLTPPRRDGNVNTDRLREVIELTRGNYDGTMKLTGYTRADFNLDVNSIETATGLIARFRSGLGDALVVTKDGAAGPLGTFTDLIVTNDAQVGNDLSVTRDLGVGRDVGITRHLTVNGNATLGDATGDAVALNGTTTVSANLTVRNTTPTTLASFVVTAGAQTVTLGAAATPGLYVDVANARTLIGTATALTSAADDKFTVVGGTSYFAGNSGPAIGLRYNASQTVGWRIGVAASGANADLVFLDDGAVEKFRIGDSSSVYASIVTGALAVTGALDANTYVYTPALTVTGTGTAAKVAVGTTSFSGSEEFRVVGDSRFEGAVVITTGGLAVTGDVTHTGTWTTWTPTITQPGTLTGTFNYARYRVDGKTAHVQVQWTKDASGSGTSGNAVVLGSIPSAIQPARTGNQAAVGPFLFSDAGTYTVGTAVTNSTTTMIFWFQGVTSPLGGSVAVASGDILSVDAMWEIA